MKLSAIETFLQWVPMIPVGQGLVNIHDATVGQVRTYRAELRHRIDTLNAIAVAVDQLLKAGAELEDEANLYERVRDHAPEAFDDD